MRKTISLLTVLFALAVLFSVSAGAANINLPDIISDHMLLQQGEEVTLWGTADAGETVMVKLMANGKTYLTAKTTAKSDGSFEVNLPAIPPGGPFELVFATKTATKTVTDVMVGELWLQGGQSNMAMPTQNCGSHAAKILPDKKIDDIRLFMNTKDDGSTERASSLSGQWMVADESTVKKYSAIGYYALKTIHDELDIPVGGICVAVSGRGMSYFMGPDSPGGAGGKLYNTKYAPIINMTVRGVMWNQFSADRTKDEEAFSASFNKLIKTWRADRNDPDLPFVYVTAYPALMKYYASWTDSYIMEDWSVARLGQIKTYYDTDNTAFCVTTDLPPQPSDSDPLHPQDKTTTAKRLGITALGAIYGKIENWQSPLYKVSAKNGDCVDVTFSSTYGGLKTTDGEAPRCFLVGATQTSLREAKAEIINENTIRLSSDSVKNIKYISYCVEAHLYPYKSVDDAVINTYPDVNVVNSEGLPLTPFYVKVGDAKKEKVFNNFATIGKRFDTVKREVSEEEDKEEVKEEAPLEEGIKILIDGEKLVCDQPPVIVSGRTLVPMRAIFEKLGAIVSWDGETQTAAGDKDGKIVSFVIGESFIGISGEKKALDVPAQILSGRTMIPARAVAEAFGCSVDWDGETQTVIIKK